MFEYMASKLTVPIDQIYFIVTQVLGLVLAWAYRYRYGHVDRIRNASRDRRLLFLAAAGLWLSWLLFGGQVAHMVNMAGGTYILLVTIDHRYQHVAVLIFSLVYLSYLHIDRMLHEYNVYSLDITAPIMIMMQKVTLLAFSLHDGRSSHSRQLAEKADLRTEEQRRQFEAAHNVIISMPSALEYVAYIFNFPTVLCGPSTFFSDFIDFVDGRRLRKEQLKTYPSVRSSLLHQITVCNLCSLAVVLIGGRFPVSTLTEATFLEANFATKLALLLLVTFLARLKYYFAWSMSEAIGNLAGFGFNGLDTKGKARYDLLRNVDIFAFENSLSLRAGIESWNKSTDRWLRKLVYERTPKRWRLLATFSLSAVWHGFYPGYYLTFLSGAMFTIAARNVRRYVRPYFVSDPGWLSFYHVATYVATRIALSYLVFPFVLLEWNISLRVYSRLYYCAHLVALVAWLVLPRLTQSNETPTSTKVTIATAAKTGARKRPTSPAAATMEEDKRLVDYLGHPNSMSLANGL